MKRIVLTALCIVAFSALQAQNCEAIMLPFFGGDTIRMQNYPQEKLEWRCSYSFNAFYESDRVPEGAVVKSITDVMERATGQHLTNDFKVDLHTLSLYAYNFEEFQLERKSGDVVICFTTPGSAHPYLVLRSSNETYMRTEFPENYK